MGNLPFDYRRVFSSMNDEFSTIKDNRTSDREGFESEHAKRERRISQQQRRKWADEPIACLPDSVGYRNACTREAKLQEQVRFRLESRQPQD